MGKAAGQEVKEEVGNNRLSDLWQCWSREKAACSRGAPLGRDSTNKGVRVKLNQACLANRREKTHQGTEDSWEKGLETGSKVLNISVFGRLWEFWILICERPEVENIGAELIELL